MGRTASTRNLSLTERSRYALDSEAHYTAVAASRPQTRGQFAAALAVAIGLLDVFCVLVNGQGGAFVEGNPLAQAVLERGGVEALSAYSWTTMAFGLALIAAGIRAAGRSQRLRFVPPDTRAFAQATLTGLIAAGLALLGWWTAWIFV